MERFPFTPDYGAQQQTQPRILKAQFGDGYAQRSEDGMRTVLPRWALQFNARRKKEADAIEAFLQARKGVESFEFVVPSSAWDVTNSPVGTGDGARTQYLLERPVAPEVPDERVPATGWTAPPQVHMDGVLLSVGADYVLSSSGLVTFTAAPASGAALTFTGKGERVARVVCESWSSTVKSFNSHDVSAEFQEVAG
ncbi:phage tail protein [Myxococcus sp. CA040A]|uniref:phage tail protein n=1 Tax=Myxococcus sp. CA040A TaxID=2741738 RepID=UPI001C2DC03C|nr:phage tail protein [Myxococcus sp. CA040A]NTX07050.1 phage tail protein [Myxococcus sp. CA040A]